MHTTNYSNTLILVSEDCDAPAGQVPGRAGTVAALQYEMLKDAPYTMTSDDLVFEVHAHRTGIAEAGREAARAVFFSKGQPCLRASPLVKTYGWGVHHDDKQRVALVDTRSARYAELIEDDSVTKVNGMRSKRAR